MLSLRESRRPLSDVQGFYGSALDLRQSPSVYGCFLNLRRLGRTTREAGELSCVRLSREAISLPLHFSLSLSPPEPLTLSLSLSISLALPLSLLRGHVWNHLVSQKTGPNDEEVECNVRSAKRGERRGEGREKIENNVQACNLKSSAQKVSQHRLRDLNFEAQIVPECLPKGPSETLRTPLGQLLAP